ncbi:ATP-binding protein [Streptomyces sp. STCH 565 A]|uniref:ATP-binding protein n=1 Tax=Streptomyces sp. STCH 565 A TaxID=2950532 RepID=UPI002075F9AF|nr:ATP-binding protein [Streptomyces sp. STCH 565 A]MCM8554961.1 ATP-binding protein [Streptomyces sp. STCH 565 A]
MTTATKPSFRTKRKSADVQIPSGISFVGTEFRSTNLERDVRSQDLHSPYVGVRALDVLDRVGNALGDLKRTRAWSFTGPYGSGKSTLSNLIDALLGHDAERATHAYEAVAATNAALAQEIAENRQTLAADGFLGAVTTARREPLSATVHRALQTAVERKWKKRVPKDISAAMAACTETAVPTTDALLNAVTTLCGKAPLLLIIDEFGKTLEYLVSAGESSHAESDVFLLQLLAEKGAGPKGLPLFMFTLQHLAFTDYASRSSSVQTQEWAKIQGRFEDVTFAPNLGDAVYLLQRKLAHSAVPEHGRKLVEAQAQAASGIWRERSLHSVVDVSAESFANLYPLHPLTAVAAPLMAAQIGQNDRSLSGFLVNDEPFTVRRTLDTCAGEAPKHASTIRIPQLYDFFFSAGRTTILASSKSSRWLEINSRLEEAHGLPEADQELLKAIGVLNLIDADGLLRATPAMIQFALNDPIDATDPERFDQLKKRLDSLVEDGLVVHRSYSDEYRIWQGTDVDIDARVREIATQLQPDDVVRYFNRHLGTNVLPNAVAAGAHSQLTGMQRHFVTAVSHQTEKLRGPKVVQDAADGMLVFHFGDLKSTPRVDSPLPVVVGVTKTPQAVLDVGNTLVALQDLMSDEELDHVARREIGERAGEFSQRITAMLAEAFRPGSDESSWYLWKRGEDTDGDPAQQLRARSYAGLVSEACNVVYHQTPHVRNEMVGRHQLTSNAARTRREVLTSMIEKTGLALLGWPHDKFPAERALYDGVVEHLGLHRAAGEVTGGKNSEGSIHTHGMSRPTAARNPSVMPVWDALEEALSESTESTNLVGIYEQLMAPPYGVKAGVVPILVVAALVMRGNDVALFEEGNYCPRLTAPIIERLNVNPERFTVKATPADQGQRSLVLDKLVKALGVDIPRSKANRNPALLAVTRGLLEPMWDLDEYSKKTRRLSDDATAVRMVLAEATDPDELVFEQLPKALGFEGIVPSAKKDPDSAEAYVGRLTAGLNEIANASTDLSRHVVETLAREFRLSASGIGELRAGLAERMGGFADASLEVSLHGFVTRVLNEMLPDDDWLGTVVVQLVNQALGDWTDRDVDGFPRVVRDRARALDRVSHLYNAVQEEPADEAVPVVSKRTKPKQRQIDTRLLTLTTPQGTEERTLIHVPKKSRNAADELVVSVIRQAEEALGPDGARILLAALAEHLSGQDSTASEKEEQL